MREVYFRGEYPRIMNVSFLQNISSSRASYLMSHLHKCKNTEAVFTSDYINILHTICFPTDCFRGTNFPLLDYLDNSPVSSHNLHLLLIVRNTLTNERETFCKYLDADKMRGRVEKSIWNIWMRIKWEPRLKNLIDPCQWAITNSAMDENAIHVIFPTFNESQ